MISWCDCPASHFHWSQVLALRCQNRIMPRKSYVVVSPNSSICRGKKNHSPNESIPLSNHTVHLLRLILRLSSRGVPVDASKAYFEQFEHESKVCYPCLNECRSMCLLFEIRLLRRHDAISTMLNVSSSPQLPINTLFSFWEIIRQVHYNLLLRKKLSREVVKVTHVRAIALALITPSRTNRAGIEMRSSLFDCKKMFDCRKKQNKKNKNKIKTETNRQTIKEVFINQKQNILCRLED